MEFVNNVTCISIHALRVEGDGLIVPKRPVKLNFYPRPPGGGRLVPESWQREAARFLSTPSGWRATLYKLRQIGVDVISIHALRVEGDRCIRRYA